MRSETIARPAVAGGCGQAERGEVRRSLALGGALAFALALLLATTGATASRNNHGSNPLKRAARGELRAAKLTTKAPSGAVTTRTLPFFSDTTLEAAEESLCNDEAVPNCDERTEAADGEGTGVDIGVDPGTGQGPSTLGCGRRAKGGNIRV